MVFLTDSTCPHPKNFHLRGQSEIRELSPPPLEMAPIYTGRSVGIFRENGLQKKNLNIFPGYDLYQEIV